MQEPRSSAVCGSGRPRAKRRLHVRLARLLAMAAFGAVIGPVALAWGLQHTSGAGASLMLTLEAFFTAVLAWMLYRESMAGRVWTAMLLLLAGGATLVLDQQSRGEVRMLGLLHVDRRGGLGRGQRTVADTGRTVPRPGRNGQGVTWRLGSYSDSPCLGRAPSTLVKRLR